MYEKKTSPASRKRWGRRYPWDSWFALGSFILLKATDQLDGDYTGRTDTMMTQVRQQASKRGLKVSLSVNCEGTSIIVSVFDGSTNHD